ncbi:TPA: AraC family transcriptional regulator [Morganella morganii]|nr:AraC family transcriptional regulator [Morganella morganii]
MCEIKINNNFSSEVIRECIIYIENNLDKKIKLDDLSIISGYTKWHMCRVFKKIYGISFGKYILLRKLSCAALDLKQNQKIIDISINYGFDSQQSFARAFKNHFNKTPSEYRRINMGLLQKSS